MNYYQGLSYMELNDSKNAEKVFESMIEEANQQLENKDAAEGGSIFGERETENVRCREITQYWGLARKA
jgi:hypothetical protein